MHQHPAKILGVERRGLYQRQERHLNRTKLPGSEAELHRGKFWARGYFVSTVGLDEVVVREYIRNQEKEDRRLEQLNLDWSSKEPD